MKGLFSHAELTVWPQITLVAFMIIFIALVAWVLRPSGKKDYEKAGHLPLDNNEEQGGKKL